MGAEIKLGLRENWRQFMILVLVNGFVGAMLGLERTILPELAAEEFNMVAKSAILSFIVVFGISKAIANYYAGALANKVGRKKLLLYGWILAIPVPLVLIYASSWTWIIAANALLGIHQGLTWSSTVVMKIDLVGPKQRGLAMGINESVGYLAVGVVAFLTGMIATDYGLRPYPFYLGLGFVAVGLVMTLLFVKDTKSFVALEETSSTAKVHKNIFKATTWGDKNLGSVSQAGLVNNLNDAMIWGILPIMLASKNFSLEEIGILVAIYPAVWGLGQIITGKLADIHLKKNLLFSGMLVQAIALVYMLLAEDFTEFAISTAVLGVGTAMVYPTFLAAIADHTHPSQRAESIGVFRLWRDLGYAVGAIIAGLFADYMGLQESVAVVAGLTMASALVIAVRMDKA